MLVDRYSGYAWTDKLKDTSTATVTAKLNGWFVEYGYPEYGGLQFQRDFKGYCDKHYITHELSSPYNPESNGLAEAAVKNMKSLILRCVDRKESLSIAIAAWRNMARADGVSPAQLFYNRRMKQLLPILPAQAENVEIDVRARDEAAERAVKNLSLIHI